MALTEINRIFIIYLLLVFGMTAQGVSASVIKVITQDLPVETCYKGNVDDVVELVNKAATVMDKEGIFPAFRRIMDPAGGFIKGELYVFVLNMKGTIVANGADPRSVGNNAFMARDQNGALFIQDMLKQANINGQGWTKYHMFSPCTSKMAEKVVYFKQVGAFVVGAGFYNNLGF